MGNETPSTIDNALDTAKKEGGKLWDNTKKLAASTLEAGKKRLGSTGKKSSSFGDNIGAIVGFLGMGLLAVTAFELGIGSFLLMGLVGAAAGGGLFDKDGLVGGFIREKLSFGHSKQGDSPAPSNLVELPRQQVDISKIYPGNLNIPESLRLPAEPTTGPEGRRNLTGGAGTTGDDTGKAPGF
jgi:hypothetical protein